MLCCLRSRLPESSTGVRSKDGKHKVEFIPSPGSESPGYPPPMPLPGVDEVDFYLPLSQVSDCDSSNDTEHMIACSLIRSNSIPTFPVDGRGPTTSNGKWHGGTVDDSKPVIIVCHGFSSWRNQMLIHHLAAGLAKELSCHTLRFDFTGNGHSRGAWSYGNFDVELRDLKAVVNFAQDELRCRVVCIAAHSKGSASALRYAWEQEDGVDANRLDSSSMIPFFVNLAGRYFDSSMSNTVLNRFTGEQRDELQRNGKFLLNEYGPRKFFVTQEGITERQKLDLSSVSRIRRAAVLTIHGDRDELVPVENGRIFESMITNHALSVVSGANHNFNGLKYMKTLVLTVTDFLRKGGFQEYVTQ